MNILKLNALVLILSAVPLAACNGASSDAPAASAQSAAKSDIVDTAAAAGSFQTLVAAVKAADLEATLRGPGPFTVFAPTDAAFAKLPRGTVEDLLKPENKAKLQSILTYHVVSGRVSSGDAAKLSSAKSVEGQSLTISNGGGGVRINDAKVVTADIACANGVIHVIDTVLMPRS